MATTEVEEDVDDGPSRGCCRYFQQQPPLKLKKTLMAGPLGVLSVFPAAVTTEVEEDVDGGALGGVVGISGSDHHRS
jgi:hypothetical protein